MKIALYIDEGREQIVLTPDGKTESDLLGKLRSADRKLSIYQGSFYECRGGWTRQGIGNDSTIIVLEPKGSDSDPG